MPDTLYDAANETARTFLASQYRTVRELDLTIARNTILDCLYLAAEDDFIAKVTAHPIYRDTARRVIKRMEPHLVQLVGETVMGSCA